MGDLRENPPISGIVRHDSHMRKSGINPEPGSLRWEATSPNTTTPSPPFFYIAASMVEKPVSNKDENAMRIKCAIAFTRKSLNRCALACSPPTKAIWVQYPAGSLLIFLMWELCRTMPLVSGFSRGSLVSPLTSFRRCSILTSSTPIGSEDLDVKSYPNLIFHSTCPWNDAGFNIQGESSDLRQTARGSPLQNISLIVRGEQSTAVQSSAGMGEDAHVACGSVTLIAFGASPPQTRRKSCKQAGTLSQTCSVSAEAVAMSCELLQVEVVETYSDPRDSKAYLEPGEEASAKLYTSPDRDYSQPYTDNGDYTSKGADPRVEPPAAAGNMAPRASIALSLYSNILTLCSIPRYVLFKIKLSCPRSLRASPQHDAALPLTIYSHDVLSCMEIRAPDSAELKRPHVLAVMATNPAGDCNQARTLCAPSPFHSPPPPAPYSAWRFVALPPGPSNIPPSPSITSTPTHLRINFQKYPPLASRTPADSTGPWRVTTRRHGVKTAHQPRLCDLQRAVSTSPFPANMRMLGCFLPRQRPWLLIPSRSCFSKTICSVSNDRSANDMLSSAYLLFENDGNVIGRNLFCLTAASCTHGTDICTLRHIPLAKAIEYVRGLIAHRVLLIGSCGGLWTAWFSADVTFKDNSSYRQIDLCPSYFSGLRLVLSAPEKRSLTLAVMCSVAA
ncbi:hypothetical protein PR048_015439 [Dryococelus australis]|uniref:Uncharacterized protein n=1 Tax=Dryococelus australis TaxID=614101 RepID=A0ABQ9HH42_9NEOP|nr:hypothetical protein PR048_015439 [Dryococelus australis]